MKLISGEVNQATSASDNQNDMNWSGGVQEEPITSDGTSTASTVDMEDVEAGGPHTEPFEMIYADEVDSSTPSTSTPSTSTPSTSTDSSAEMKDVEAEKITDMFSGNKVFVLVTGNTLKAHEKVIEILQTQKPDLQVVEKVNESDYILVFCPIASRAGTDVEAALKKLQDIAGTKPAVLVVLHHTFQTDWVVPDSNRAVKRKNSVTVDCLFHEDLGLLHCPKNTESLERITRIIKPPEDSTWAWFPSVPSLTSWINSSVCFSSTVREDQSQREKGPEKEQETETKEKDSVLRILVLGRNDSGKSSVKNIIIGKEEKAAASSAESTASKESKNTEGEVAGRKVTVVETPDLFSAGLPLEKLRKDVEEAIKLSKPGPHAFLLIIPLPLSEDIKVNTEEELKVTFTKMEEIFGDRCLKHTMIIFSVTNESVKNTFNQFEKNKVQSLEKCGNRYHFLNIEQSEDGSQVSELLEKIEKMVGGNRENYSSEVYLKTLASVGGIEKKISSELEKQDHPATEKMRNTEKTTKRKHEPEQEEEMEQSPKMPKFEKENRENREMEIQKMHEEENMEKERNEMKTFLSGIWRDILNSNMKMQEEIEKKDRQMEKDNKIYAELFNMLNFPKDQHDT
ncbi:uncharacterized protein LOC131348265 isoform X1 [Hemibagrus wyckioides]|uniref:uncharacterized protein LOC131348265 isoform X1 n=1 Tax=Hemibagrus wyckioides TaxID=337641 RepID=UPI00266B60CF|nr:uncharacterized protein LOC131348265 isoform X1 [Hemibagrus wyckioides]